MEVLSEVIVRPGGLKGTIHLPPSKSHTLRACLFAAMAEGRSCIQNFLPSPDTLAMIEACRQLGAQIVIEEDRLHIWGGLKGQKSCTIDAQNSGQVLRFCGAVSALLDVEVIITGDESLQRRRPCRPLVEGLCQLGAKACSTNGFAPISIRGPIKAGRVVIDGRDSQPVSALMIAASRLEGTTEIVVKEAGERPWLTLTLAWLARMGVDYEELPDDRFKVHGKPKLPSFNFTVPGDLSSLAFLLAIGLLTESELMIHGVDLEDVQGDRVIVEILQKMGAAFTFLPGAIHVKGPQIMQGRAIDVNDCIDALPILAVVGAFAKGTTHLYNGAMARNKESDRIANSVQELTKMGAECQEHLDGLTISQKRLSGATLESHNDHRMAMALSVAALAATGPSVLRGISCVKKSYPQFFSEVKRLGGEFEAGTSRL